MRSFFSVVFVFIAITVYGQNRVITTGVPFLLITSDARSAGMGEQGVATTPDAFSQNWNPSKYSFAPSQSGIGVSYTPYLSQLVNDIFLANVSYYRVISERDLGDKSKIFQFKNRDWPNTSILSIHYRTSKRICVDFSYALKLNQSFSLEFGAFINSDQNLARY